MNTILTTLIIIVLLAIAIVATDMAATKRVTGVWQWPPYVKNAWAKVKGQWDKNS